MESLPPSFVSLVLTKVNPPISRLTALRTVSKVFNQEGERLLSLRTKLFLHVIGSGDRHLEYCSGDGCDGVDNQKWWKRNCAGNDSSHLIDQNDIIKIKRPKKRENLKQKAIQILRCMPQLKVLVTSIDFSLLSKIMETCCDIECLSVLLTSRPPRRPLKGVKHFSVQFFHWFKADMFPELDSLFIASSACEDVDLMEDIQCLPKGLTRIKCRTDVAYLFLSPAMETVEHLDVSDAVISRITPFEAANLKSFTCTMSFHPNDEYGGILIQETLLRSLKNSPFLEELTFLYGPVPESATQELFSSIQSLRKVILKEITDSTLRELCLNNSDLEEVVMHRSFLSDSSLTVLSTLRRLKRLKIGNTYYYDQETSIFTKEGLVNFLHMNSDNSILRFSFQLYQSNMQPCPELETVSGFELANDHQLYSDDSSSDTSSLTSSEDSSSDTDSTSSE